MKHYKINYTLDKRVMGRFQDPHTIEITSKEFIKYYLDKFRNIQMYWENREGLYENMPDNLEGKLLKRKNVIDYMTVSPMFCISLVAVISNKFKLILERLNVSKDEYVLKRISIKGFSENFYLLFVPLIRYTEFIFPKCVFRKDYRDKTYKIFNTREEYDSTEDKYSYDIIVLTLEEKYKDYDLLNPMLTSGRFFSERLLNAMQEENIVGYDIVREGAYHYVEIRFANE